MKILMLNYEFPPLGGGAGNATDNISRELVKKRHDVTVLTSRYGEQPKFEIKNGVKIYRVPSWRKSIHDCGFSGAYTYVLFAALKLFKLKKNNYDVLHYFFSLPTGLLSLLPYAFRKTPYIVSLRGSDVPYYDIYNKNVHLFNLILKPVNRYIWGKAKKVVALSNSLKLTALRTAPEQVFEVIPNGVEMDLFKPKSKASRSNKKLKLITVSRLINRKGIDHIIKALAETRDKDIKLIIIGTGNYESFLKKLCEKLKLNDVVHFRGYYPREKLPELYNDADVFILPSLAESFGLVFAEAMACGLPIIGAKTGGIVDLVKKENGILVEPGNIQEIKEAIKQMKFSSEMRNGMSKKNRDKIVKHYRWEGVSQKYLQIYQKAN